MTSNKTVQLSSSKRSPALSTLRRLAASRVAPWGHRLRWLEPWARPVTPGLPEQLSQYGRCDACGEKILIAQQTRGGTSSDRMTGTQCSRIYLK